MREDGGCRGREMERRGQRSAPGGALGAAGVGSLRASVAAAPLPPSPDKRPPRPLRPSLPLILPCLLCAFHLPLVLLSCGLSSSLLSPPFQVPRHIVPLCLPPARFSSLSSWLLLSPLFVLALSCQLSGFSQQEMKGTSWEMGVMGRWNVCVCVCVCTMY